MAVDVKYRIKAKDESKKGVDSAKKNVESLGKATKAFGAMAKAAIAGVSFALIIREAKQMVDLFAEQEKVELRLIAAAANNPYINGDSVRSLRDTAAAMQKVSIFGDEAIIQQQAFLTTLGMTEEQINSVLAASIDLASTGIVTLDSAVKNISKTYGGMTGELGELIPSLKDLTTEELEAGAAVELINEAYGGMAEAAASGVAGAKDQFKNAFGDLKESIGGILGTLQAESMRQMQPMIENLTAWIQDHQRQILNFFINFPDIVRVSFALAQQMMQKIFTWDFIVEAFPVVLRFMWNQFLNTFDLINSFLLAIGETIWQPLKTGFEWAAYGIKIAWQNTVDFLIKLVNMMSTPIEFMINGIILGINKVVEAGQKIGLFRRATGVEDLNLEISMPEWTTPTAPGAISGTTIKEAWGDAFAQIPRFFQRTVDNYSNLLDESSGWFADELDAFKASVGEIINRELPERFKSATEPLIDALDGNTGAIEDTRERIPITGAAGGTSLDPGLVGGSQMLLEGMGDTLKMFDGLSEALGPIVGMFLEMIMSLDSVMAVADPLSTILRGALQVVAPLVDQVLAPLVDGLMNLGRVVGVVLLPVFNILGPVANILSIALQLMTIPIKAFGVAVDFVSRPIQFLADIFQWAANVIKVGVHNLGEFLAHPFRADKRDIWTSPTFSSDAFTRPLVDFSAIDRAAEEARIIAEAGTGGYTGPAASYTQAPTINVYVDIYTEVITGETGGIRELALIINREIEAAALLGIT